MKIKNKIEENVQAYTIRFPKKQWKWLKKTSVDQERSMQDIIFSCLEKYEKKLNNKLKDDDCMIS